MKIIYIFLLLLISNWALSQNNKGIHLQAIARNQNGMIIANKQISLRLSILNDTTENTIEYQEIISVTTNVLGLFFINIGTEARGKVITIGHFEEIEWGQMEHYLQVEIDPNNALQFIVAGMEKINYVPLALFAEKANMVNSIVPIELGGTGVANMSALKHLLNIDKLNNTPDSLKPLSIAMELGLNEKLKKSDTLFLSNRINLKLNSADTLRLSNRINTKITIGNVSSNDITNGLGYAPVKNNFGLFYDTSRQSTTIATATAVKLNFQQFANRLSVNNNTAGNPTRITVNDAGVYHVNYTLQFIKADAGNDEINIWIRKNSAAYLNTNTVFTLQGLGIKNIFSGSYFIELGANDYIELFYSVKNMNSVLAGSPSTTITPSRPATPSVLISMHAVNE